MFHTEHVAKPDPVTQEAREIVNDLAELYMDMPDGDDVTGDHRGLWTDFHKLVGLCKGLITAVDALSARATQPMTVVVRPDARDAVGGD